MPVARGLLEPQGEMTLEVSVEVIGVRLSLHVHTRGKPDGPGFPLVAPLSVPHRPE